MRLIDIIIVICWIIFWLYWIISAFGSKKNTSLALNRFIGIRISIFVLAVVLFRLFNVQNYAILNRAPVNNDAVLIAGLTLFLAGLLLAVWARIYLGKNWGMPMTQKEEPELVTTGPYRYVRHPIYSGILVAMLGTAIASSLVWLVVFAVTATYFIFCAVEEEKIMTEQFPKNYLSYKGKTKMLIPFVI